MPERLLAAVWAYFDAAGPLIGRPWPIAYREDEQARVATLREFGVFAFTALLYPHKPAWLLAQRLGAPTSPPGRRAAGRARRSSPSRRPPPMCCCAIEAGRAGIQVPPAGRRLRPERPGAGPGVGPARRGGGPGCDPLRLRPGGLPLHLASADRAAARPPPSAAHRDRAPGHARVRPSSWTWPSATPNMLLDTTMAFTPVHRGRAEGRVPARRAWPAAPPRLLGAVRDRLPEHPLSLRRRLGRA